MFNTVESVYDKKYSFNLQNGSCFACAEMSGWFSCVIYTRVPFIRCSTRRRVKVSEVVVSRLPLPAATNNQALNQNN